MFQWKGFITGDTKRWLLSLQQEQNNGLHPSDQYANEKEQSVLVWLNNKMEVSQSVLLKSCVIYFLDSHPIHVARAQKRSYSNEI